MKNFFTQDGFQWILLTKEQAITEQRKNNEIYLLHDDGSESLVFNEAEILGASENLAMEGIQPITN
jgi:hypothetical protein